MSRSSPVRQLIVPIAAIGVMIVASGDVTDSPRLDADTTSAFADRDGDLIPDRLEWVLLLDPTNPDTDGDGADDFLHAVQNRLSLREPRTRFGYDDEARVLVHSSTDANGSNVLWADMLFRFAGGDVQALRSVVPYVDRWGQRIPISQLIGRGRSHVALRVHPTEGLYVLCSFELGAESAFRSMLPCTVGATIVIGDKTIHTGTFLSDAAGATAALVPVAPDSTVVQTLRPAAQDDPFWTSSRVCVMRLSVVTTMTNGTLCEISDANCVSNGRLACPPTCLSSRGQMMFFPDGLSTVTGGSR